MFILDTDCHNYWCSATVLEPYMEGLFKDMFIRGEKTGPRGAFPHAHRPWFHPEGFSRHDVNPVEEHGFMYGRDLADPDDNLWGALWMDASAMPGAGQN